MKAKRVLIGILLILVLALVASGISACNKTPATTEPPAEEGSGPRFIAHRGYSSAYLGNTEAAFRAAAERGFYGIETDIRKTKDGYYICNHDATVTYKDGSTKAIGSTKRADLLSKPLQNDKTKSDTYLCTFETYLQACKAGEKVAVIELKDYFNADEIDEIFEIIDAEYDRKKVAFISFLYAPLATIKSEYPSIEVQYLSQNADDFFFDSCIEDGISIDVRQTILTEELATRFHEAGLKVNVWTVNTEDDLQFVYGIGVDYVTTDVFYED